MPPVEHGLVRASFAPPLDTREPRITPRSRGNASLPKVR
jgi:hypothetical protein